jgi:radical SAM protein with 4Fe4S-binding SPASM domain
MIVKPQDAIARFPQPPVTIACENDRSTLHCRWPWSAAYVTAEGDVTPCCNCPDKRELFMGNLLEKPFSSIWNGKAYRIFRRELREGVPQICRNCPAY